MHSASKRTSWRLSKHLLWLYRVRVLVVTQKNTDIVLKHGLIRNQRTASLRRFLCRRDSLQIPWRREFSSEFSCSKQAILQFLPKSRRFCRGGWERSSELREFALQDLQKQSLTMTHNVQPWIVAGKEQRFPILTVEKVSVGRRQTFTDVPSRGKSNWSRHFLTAATGSKQRAHFSQLPIRTLRRWSPEAQSTF